jgi:hypothetical protein
MRLLEAPTTRLGIDAQRASQWRGMGFDAVLNERTPTPATTWRPACCGAAWRSSRPTRCRPRRCWTGALTLRWTVRKAAPAWPSSTPSSRAAHAGMPYGLPGLSAAEMDTIARWLRAGAPDDPQPPLPRAGGAPGGEWEALLNGGSLKERLMSRYLYEHLFLGHLVFEGDAQRMSSAWCARPRRPGSRCRCWPRAGPYDDPGVAASLPADA